MKFRMIALICVLALSLVGWTQEPATPATSNSTTAPQAQAGECSHHNMEGMKEGESCCHHSADAKDSCCGAGKCEMKDGKSCCAGKDMKAAMKQCKKECKKNACCKKGECGAAKGDKAAMGCCGGKCERHSPTPAGM